MQITAYSQCLFDLQIRDKNPQIPGVVADVDHDDSVELADSTKIGNPQGSQVTGE